MLMRETYVLLPGDEDHEDLEEVDGGMGAMIIVMMLV